MDRDEILSIYDPWYADTYDERFHGGDLWNDNLAAHKLEIVGELIPEGGRWLDVGCGTGKHLSAYPDVEREGLDLSPSMVSKARAANPGVTIHQGSYLDEHPEWVGEWDVVSNLWLSYQFVDSLKLVEQAIANMASWVAPTGALFLHIADCEDVARGVQLPWEDPETPVFGDSLFVTSVTWTWKESNGRTHHDLVAPQLQRMVNILARSFEEIEVRRWPAIDPESALGRPKGIVGRKKRETPLAPEEVGNAYPYEVVYPPRDHPREQDPRRPGDPDFDQPAAAIATVVSPVPAAGEELAELKQEISALRDELTSLTSGPLAHVPHEVFQLRGDVSTLANGPLADLQVRVMAVHDNLGALGTALFPPEDEERYDTLAVVHEQVWNLRRELSELHEAWANTPPPVLPAPAPPPEPAPPPPPPPPDPAPPATLGTLSTKRLAGEVARRLNPFRRSFWRRLTGRG